MALVGFEEFEGKWTLVRNEGLDEYLEALGIGYIKRKLAAAVTTKYEITKNTDETVRMITWGYNDKTLTLNTEYTDKDALGNKMTFVVTWNPVNKVLHTDMWPIQGSKCKRSSADRSILENGEMLQEITLTNEKVVCRRYFKKENGGK